MFVLIVVLLHVLSWHFPFSSAQSTFIQNQEIFYKEPRYPIENFNLTIGMIVNAASADGTPSKKGLSVYLGALCSMAANKTSAPVKGSFNLLAINSKLNSTLTYNEFMNLLKMDLNSAYPEIEAGLQVPYPGSLGALVGSGDFKQFFSAVPFFRDYRIPAIAVDSPSNIDSIADQIVNLQAEGEAAFVLSPYVTPSLTVALVGFLLKMNFTLIAPIFQDDDAFGAGGIFALQEFAEVSNNAIFAACGRVMDPYSPTAPQKAQEFVTCVKRYNKIELILLWTTSQVGLDLIKLIVESGGKDLKFLIAASNPTDPSKTQAYWEYIEGSFFISEAVAPFSEQEIFDCLETIGKDPFEDVSELMARLYAAENCLPYNVNATIPFCELSPETGEYIQTPCMCNYYDLLISLGNKYSYSIAADAIQTYSQAIYMLQNNCTLINEYYLVQGVLSRPIDYCAITEFTPAILASAVTAVKFQSNTGEISFFPNTLVRRRANFEVYQWGVNGTSKPIAIFKEGNLEIDYDAIKYPGDRVPISSKPAHVECFR